MLLSCQGISFWNVIAPVLSTVQVYLSNISLYNKLLTIRGSDYLAIINQDIRHNL